MEIGLGASLAATLVALIVQLLVVVVVLVLLRPLFVWLFGAGEVRDELRALRSEVRSLRYTNVPQQGAPAPRDTQITGDGWKGAEQAAIQEQSAAQRMRYVD